MGFARKLCDILLTIGMALLSASNLIPVLSNYYAFNLTAKQRDDRAYCLFVCLFFSRAPLYFFSLCGSEWFSV